MALFKQTAGKEKEFKVHYSSKRTKKRDDSMEKCFTTPRKPKNIIEQTSTKITKKGAITTDLKRETISVSEFNQENVPEEQWKVIGYILQL